MKMLIVPNSLPLVIFLITFLCISVNPSAGGCPSKGKIGGKKVPDVLSLTKDQKGFTATVEIITPEEQSVLVTETYNGAKKYGILDVHWLDLEITYGVYYYHATKEKYVTEDGDCVSNSLEVEDKYVIINIWIKPDTAIDEIDLFGSLDVLGPTVLMVYAASVSDKAQYVGTERIDGRTVDHWFHCFSDDIYLDWWFESSTSLPFRFSLSSSKNTTDPHVYNFLIFTPVANSLNDVIQYPIGYGCHREAKGQPEFPAYALTLSYSIDAEAMIMYNNPDEVVLSSIRQMKYQDTISLEISDGPNTTRIIQNPIHSGRYVINAQSGECESRNFDWDEDGAEVPWPYHEKRGFNLLKVLEATTSQWSNYMGQVNTDDGLMDVWEIDFYQFFAGDTYADASVSYYFPAIDRSKKPIQAPAKMVIKFHNKRYISMDYRMPYQIEIIIIDYSGPGFDLSDRYDVSGCYDGPGEFTWFQIVMSDPSTHAFNRDLTNIRTSFSELLSTFIPKIRIPEIVVNLYDFNFYITCKLLERPPFKFHYSSNPNYEIENPTSIVVRDHLEDCGDLCTNGLNCKEFSYCNDFTCQIFDSTASYSSVLSNENCTWYTKLNYGTGESMIERNILASSRNILQQIKQKINSGEFLLPKYSLSADDLFIVSGPEEVGGIENEFDDSTDLIGDEYAVIVSDSRLSTGKTVDSISYSDCLKLCQNDDDCYSLSYCFNQNKQCILSRDTKANLTRSLADKTSHADSCDVFEKSFMTFYRKFPGQSLVKDAIATFGDIDESECARKCYESTDFPCRSFDFCKETVGSKELTDCFLHRFHAVEDTDHEITGTVWDFSKSKCDHYAVRLSRDYTHYIGKQYKERSVTILKDIGDVGLERCAADCNSEDGNCVSFEYCETVSNTRESTIVTSCRLSSNGDSTTDFEITHSPVVTCSIYLNKVAVNRNANTAKGSDHFGIAIGLGSFFFVIAFAAGIVGSIYYQRRFSS